MRILTNLPEYVIAEIDASNSWCSVMRFIYKSVIYVFSLGHKKKIEN